MADSPIAEHDQAEHPPSPQPHYAVLYTDDAN